ncbi:M28 family peptidase [Pullulanibacillus camelliae]|nr:M28 family peptidase [Pullulanibacillus camelliae]
MTAFKEVTEKENQLLEEVSKDQLMDFTRNIAKEVRLSGTEEELRAFEYAKAQLEAVGFETELQFTNGYISLPGKAALKVDDVDFECITHAMALSAENLTAEIIDLGLGKDADYSENNVQGKIVLMDGIATPGAVKKATEQGAKGAIFINADYTHEMIVSPVWGTPVPDTVKLLPNIPVISITNANGKRLREKVGSGKNTGEMHTEIETRFRPIPTLIAEIQGTVEPDKFVMFSGHIDSWHYGVMDNGTANAIMLEVGRLLSKYKEQLHRSLRLAFWSGHSHGRYSGSAAYCDAHWEELTEHCVLHVNVDSSGGKGATVLTESNCMKETRDLAREAIGALTGDLFRGSRFGRSGDQSFWGTGTPSLFMGCSEQPPATNPAASAFSQLFGAGDSGGFGWWWHTTEDTLDKIDPDYLKRDCKVYLLILYRTLTEALIPINQLAAVEDIIEGLQKWQEKAGEHFDLSLSLKRADELRKSVTTLQDEITEISVNDQEEIRRVNEALMALSRFLVPLNYVKNSVFNHDLALNQQAVPKLSEIDRLITLDKESDAYQFSYTALVRNFNEVNYTLKQAKRVVDSILVQLK